MKPAESMFFSGQEIRLTAINVEQKKCDVVVEKTLGFWERNLYEQAFRLSLISPNDVFITHECFPWWQVKLAQRLIVIQVQWFKLKYNGFNKLATVFFSKQSSY